MIQLSDKPVFCVGDVHGHFDRLEALLRKAEVEDKDCYVVSLGDLGHFGHGTSKTADEICYQFALDRGFDYVLWGNHDRAVIDSNHKFSGYESPPESTLRLMSELMGQGRMPLALDVHGWLLTHAGLHEQFKFQRGIANEDRHDVAKIVEFIGKYHGDLDRDNGVFAVVNAIGESRGGDSPHGGILWRDITEPLFNVPQVFGHSASPKRRVRGDKDRWWCIDIGGKGGYGREAECLAGIWLPYQRIIEVRLNENGDFE